MNIKDFKRIHNIERNLNKLKSGIEYLLGDYFEVRDKKEISTVIRLNKNKFIFNHYERKLNDRH